MEEEKNGIIKSTFLGIEDHGIMTFYISIEGDGWGQSAGGYFLEGTWNGLSKIRQILEALEIDSWEKLPNTPVRIRSTRAKVKSIGHFIKNKWFDFEPFEA